MLPIPDIVGTKNQMMLLFAADWDYDQLAASCIKKAIQFMVQYNLEKNWLIYMHIIILKNILIPVIIKYFLTITSNWTGLKSDAFKFHLVRKENELSQHHT